MQSPDAHLDETTGPPAAPFPRARWVGALWMAAWIPAYGLYWGWGNFLALCDVAVALTCLGLWRGSPLLLSSQTLPSIVVGAMWTADVGARLASGKHLIGGTEYMWHSNVPLIVRLLSLFHIGLPLVLLSALRRVGYDRRAIVVQSALTAAVLVASRAIAQEKNLNYAFRDPFGRTWGAAPLHLGAIFVGTVALVYLPTHLALRRWLPRPR
jgi:hypothetical protein